jgi:hypothetical protein
VLRRFNKKGGKLRQVVGGSYVLDPESLTGVSKYKADAIEKIMALNPSVWQWNSGANKGMTATGFVAQEVESVIPFMVGGKEYKSLAYQMLHAYEISAIQSHEERIKELENKVNAL